MADNILDKFEKIKNTLEEEEKRKMRFQGKLDAKMEALNEQGHSTVTKAKAHIKKLEKKLEKHTIELDNLIEKFEEDFPELVGDE